MGLAPIVSSVALIGVGSHQRERSVDWSQVLSFGVDRIDSGPFRVIGPLQSFRPESYRFELRVDLVGPASFKAVGIVWGRIESVGECKIVEIV